MSNFVSQHFLYKDALFGNKTNLNILDFCIRTRSIIKFSTWKMSSSEGNQTNKKTSTKNKQQIDKQVGENDFLSDHLQSHDHKASSSQGYKTNLSSNKQHSYQRSRKTDKNDSQSPPNIKSKDVNKVYEFYYLLDDY